MTKKTAHVSQSNDFRLWTTTLIPSADVANAKTTWQEYYGFGYPIGGIMPNDPHAHPATRMETNLRCGNQVLGATVSVHGIEWCLCQTSDKSYQPTLNFGDFSPTPSDFAEVCHHGLLMLHVGGETPVWELKLDSRPVERDATDNVGGIFKLRHPIEIRCGEKFWAALHLSRPPVFSLFPADKDRKARGTLVLRFSLVGTEKRSV